MSDLTPHDGADDDTKSLTRRASRASRQSNRWSVAHPVKTDEPPKRFKKRRFFRRFVPARFRKEEATSDEHYVHLNNAPENAGFKPNLFITSKYTLLTWIPYNLWEQFRRVANTYFLVIFLMQLVPGVSPFPLYVTAAPLAAILGVTLFKEGYEDLLRHKADYKVNNAPVKMLDRTTGESTTAKSKTIRIGDIICCERDQTCAADMVILSTEHGGSNEGSAMCWVDTANLDGETRLKVRRSVALDQFLENVEEDEQASPEDLLRLKTVITSDPPNPWIEVFSGRMDATNSDAVVQLSRENMILRGSILRNTKRVWGVVVGAGPTSKLRLNQQLPAFKFSSLERQLNTCLIVVFSYQTILCAVLASMQIVMQSRFYNDYGWGFPAPGDEAVDWIYAFLSWFILCSFMIPMSLYVILEMGKMMGGIFIHFDETMYSRDGLKRPAKANTTSLVEELGSVEYILTDKTGTLTDNEMRFTHCATMKSMYELDMSNPDSVLLRKSSSKRQSKSSVVLPSKSVQDVQLKQLMLVMAACNELEVEREDGDDFVTYSGESPDEVALATTASDLGYVLEARTPSKVRLKFASKNVTKDYTVLAVLPFTSSRKRMGIVLQETGSKKAFVLYKGADNIMFDILPQQTKQIGEYVHQMSKLGLRTLVLASSVIDLSSEMYQSFKSKYDAALVSMENRDGLIGDAFLDLEHTLQPVGCTGVEDKLSEGVGEALQDLIKANIQVAVLTGDKTETAFSICTTCGLFKPGSKFHMITEPEESLISDYFTKELAVDPKDDVSVPESDDEDEELDVEAAMKKHSHHALVISGDALKICLDTPDLYQQLVLMMKRCYTTVCTRMTPKQKAYLTKLVGDEFGVVTLSIGDGANDVTMIQEARVGVGVFGKEGSQAVNSADFAIHKFADLIKLIFVHGSISKLRITTAARASLFSNMAFNMPQVFLGFFSAFSAQSVELENILTYINTVITGAFILTIATFDRELRPQELLQRATFYKARAYGFNLREFFVEMGFAFWYAIVAFFMTFFVFNEVWVGSGQVAGLWGQSTLLCTILVNSIVITLAMRFHLVTYVHVFAMIVGFAVLWLCLIGFPMFYGPNATDNGYILNYVGQSFYYMTASIVGIVTSVTPYWFVKCYYNLFKPTETQLFRENKKLQEKAGEVACDDDESFTGVNL